MAYEVKDNTGTLGVNNRKEKETHPDYSGSMRIDGRDYWISGWKKVAGNGSSFLSLAFKPKDGTAARPEQFAKAAQDAFGLPETPAVKTRKADPEDSIPF
jgi:hypothetical protein